MENNKLQELLTKARLERESKKALDSSPVITKAISATPIFSQSERSERQSHQAPKSVALINSSSEAREHYQAPITLPVVTATKSRLELLREKMAAAKQPELSSADGFTDTLDKVAENNGGNSPAAQNTPETPIAAITYNSEQQQFVDLATRGNSCVLIGAAGTGKTTCMKGTVTSLITSGRVGKLTDASHKKLPVGTPGIVCVSFTRRAVANLRKAMPADLKANCITIHALLQYEPTETWIQDPVTFEEKKKFEFKPTRDEVNPLDPSIKVIIIDESSMVSVELFEQILRACEHAVQFIFLGDIQQLPPVFGSAILGYKMVELPVVELTQVYRQALESPIIRLAHRILSGQPIPVSEFDSWKVETQLTLHNWKKKVKAEDALATIAAFFVKAINLGKFDINEDMILIPFNKSCGTDELNKHIANHIARRDQKLTHEIVSGFNKFYFSEGDKVLVSKEDAFITRIEKNEDYAGKSFQAASATLDYWGHNNEGYQEENVAEYTDAQIDKILELAAADSEERVKQASHTIYYKRSLVDPDAPELSVSTASEINSMILAYALTIHKSQGSEWRKVFVVFHQSHATMLQRELLYTAVTRAREELYVICEDTSFVTGILSQRIKGNTLAEKSEYFKGKIAEENSNGN